MNTVPYFNGTHDVNVFNIDKLINLNETELNDIAIGPQEEFFQRLDRINSTFSHYNLKPIHITNKWNWKPGTYDIVKQYLWKNLDLHKKAKNCEYLISRTQDKANYLRYVRNQFQVIEIERAKLKRLGVTSTIDIDVFNETCVKFVENIQEQCKIASEISDNKVSINPRITINGRVCDFYLDIILTDLTMEIYDGAKDTAGKSIQSFQIEPIHIVVKLNLRQLLANTRQNPKLIGYYMSENKNSFPYISHRGINSTEYGTVCTDKHTDDVYKALKTTDYTLLTITLLQWAQYYHIKHTNPYNKTYLLHLGLPESYNEEYKSTLDKDSISNSCGRKMHSILQSNLEGRIMNLYNFHNKCIEINCSLITSCSSSLVTTRRIERLESDFGVQSEAMVLMISEYLKSRYEDKPQTILDIFNQLGNIYYDLDYFEQEYREGIFDDSIDIDYLCEYMSSELLHVLICDNYWNSIMWDFLERHDICEKPVEKELTTDELLALTQQWAQNPGRR